MVLAFIIILDSCNSGTNKYEDIKERETWVSIGNEIIITSQTSS